MSNTLPPVQPTAATAASTRTWEVLCHISALSFFVVPFGNVLGPLVVWLMKRDASPGVDAHGRESVNFHLSWTLYWLVASSVVAALCAIIVGIVFLPFLFLGWIVGGLMLIVLSIVGAMKASNGEIYQYPLTIRFF